MLAMKHLALFCLLLLSTSAFAQHPAADDAGFVPLFNGKDLTGWKTTGNWLVEPDGSLSLHPREGEKGWKRFDAYIATEKLYGDFVLDLEFKINAKGNSGVFMRVADMKKPVKTGFEVQILDTYGLAKPGHHDCRGIVHGTTLVTNTVIERKGARVGLLTTRGFRHSPEMGKEMRNDLYDLFLEKAEPIVPRALPLALT